MEIIFIMELGSMEWQLLMNGLALYSQLIPYGGTFLIFFRLLQTLNKVICFDGFKVIYIFSHDSIGLGEDGPTHQPIEQLMV